MGSRVYAGGNGLLVVVLILVDLEHHNSEPRFEGAILGADPQDYVRNWSSEHNRPCIRPGAPLGRARGQRNYPGANGQSHGRWGGIWIGRR